jgi:hypothetical protein
MTRLIGNHEHLPSGQGRLPKHDCLHLGVVGRLPECHECNRRDRCMGKLATPIRDRVAADAYGLGCATDRFRPGRWPFQLNDSRNVCRKISTVVDTSAPELYPRTHYVPNGEANSCRRRRFTSAITYGWSRLAAADLAPAARGRQSAAARRRAPAKSAAPGASASSDNCRRRSAASRSRRAQ